MAHKFRDYLGTVTEFENEAATGSEKRPVVGLPAATVALLTAAATSAKQDTGNTSLASILSGLSSLATSALQTAGNSTLSTISTAIANVLLALNPASCVSGQNTDIDQTSEDLGSQACTVGAWVKNTSTGSQFLYVSPNNVAATTTNGYQLFIGEERFFPCRNISELKVIASADNAKAGWLAI